MANKFKNDRDFLQHEGMEVDYWKKRKPEFMRQLNASIGGMEPEPKKTKSKRRK